MIFIGFIIKILLVAKYDGPFLNICSLIKMCESYDKICLCGLSGFLFVCTCGGMSRRVFIHSQPTCGLVPVTLCSVTNGDSLLFTFTHDLPLPSIPHTPSNTHGLSCSLSLAVLYIDFQRCSFTALSEISSCCGAVDMCLVCGEA